jgi:dephospho-CoA kinase
MLRVGLTGGIGSGKSTVARMFAARDVPIIDTDELAHELAEPGQAGHAAIVRQFGPDVLDADGRLDRTKMRARVFADPDERRRLENILHPEIRAEARRRLELSAAPYAIVAVPLLVETGFGNLVDRVLVVDCDEALQVQRTATRSGLTIQEIERVMAAQASRAQRLARADDVIENNAGLPELEVQVARLHAQYLALARST